MSTKLPKEKSAIAQAPLGEPEHPFHFSDPAPVIETKKFKHHHIVIPLVVIEVAILLLIGGFLGSIYLFPPYKVQNNSMYPSVKQGQVVFLDRLGGKATSIKKGELILFKIIDSKETLKRVIGTPGDTISIKEGKVYVNKALLNDPTPNTITTDGSFLKENTDFTVGQNTYFVLGDNREVSLDSRHIGPIKSESIIGRVWLTL